MTVLPARANRLAGRANRRRRDGTRGWRAARAWRVLTGAAQRGDTNAIEAIWQAWLRAPADDSWGWVSRWRSPDDVLAAAVDPVRADEARDVLGAFCVRHGMVPDNAVERAVFFVLTGQREQYQASDPDGTLLAAGYRGATEPTREALRRTMIGLGELNLVRVIADRADHPPTADEADYLARRLADAGEWEQLWRLIPRFPLARAVGVARLFTGWRPPDDAGRAFFERLAATDPDAITAPAAAAVTRIKLRDPYGFSFAPDGSEVAIRHRAGTTVFDRHGGQQVANYPGREQSEVMALGNGAVVYIGGRRHEWSLMRHAPGKPPYVLLAGVSGSQIGRRRRGFFVHTGNGFWFGPAEGGSFAHLGGRELPGIMVATEAASRRFAMRTAKSGHFEVALHDADLNLLADARLDGARNGAFCGPERLLLWNFGPERPVIESWRRDGTALVRDAETDLGRTYLEPAVLPARNRVVVCRPPGVLAWYDARTLRQVDGLAVDTARHVAASPDGWVLAVARLDGAEVHDLWLHEVAGLLGRPLATMSPSELETLGLRDEFPSPVMAAVELLRAGLAYRFGADVALGSGDRIAGGADDIALGGG